MSETAARGAAMPDRLLAEAWASALTEAGGPAAIADQGFLTELSATLLFTMRETPFLPGRAADVGRSLATRMPGESAEVLGRSLRVLTQGLSGPSHRLGAVLEEVANGYVNALQGRTLAEQESIRTAEADAQRALSETLRHQAMHDPLTGLPNRTALFDRLSENLAGDAQAGLLYLDLDGFKGVNDQHGHDVGDQLLSAVAERIGGACLAKGAMAARMGGDEFVVLAGPGIGALIALASDILAAVRQPILTTAGQISITACAGITEFPVAAGPVPAAANVAAAAGAIVAQADAALYQAKSAGPGMWAVHDPHRPPRAAGQATALVSSICAGLDRGEFRLEYLPVAGLPDCQVAGATAVQRWDHPEFGELGGEIFVPLADASEAAPQLSQWLIGTACRDAAAWQRPDRSIFVSVPMTPGDLVRPGLADQVAQILAAAGLPPDLLQLEFGEAALAASHGQAEAELERLDALGVRIAVRGFGSGDSGFRYLRRLPVGAAILDEELTSDPDEPVIAALTCLAHARGITVTARNVKTVSDAHVLTRLGVDAAQGALFSGPVPAGRVAGTLRTPAAA